MKSCWIESYHVKANEPYTMYKEIYSLAPYNDFKQDEPNIWKGHFGPFIITVTQEHQHHEIEEKDISIEKKDDFNGDPSITYAYPSKEDIAKALNKHLDNIYR